MLSHNIFLRQYCQKNLRNCQLKQLDILSVIHDICLRHKIDYWLDGGSCLGATRHKGFIPWDDDIDIAMKLVDIPHFFEVAKSELPENYFLQTEETDPSCRFPIIKIRDTNSFFVEPGDNFSRDYHKGVFIDIFPMLPYPTIPKWLCKFLTKGYCVSNAILLMQHRYSWRSAAELFYFGFKRILCKTLWNVLNAFCDKKEYYGNRLCDNGYGMCHRKDSIFPVHPIEFEGKMFLGPSNPDAYLKEQYGDWKQLPPEEDRKVHAVFFLTNLE